MKQVCVGIRWEDKSELERRSPLTPDDVQELSVKHGIQFTVEPSASRVYDDSDFEKAGATIKLGLDACDLIVGIKEVPIKRLVEGKPHLFFSHTIKGQSYNMGLLAEVLHKQITLIDYEKVTDDQGRRLIAFSTQAGQAGMINSLWSLGQRWLAQGIETPLANLKQACDYTSGLEGPRKDIREAAEAIRENGLPESVAPIVVACTGIGRVSSGAQDILDDAKPVELNPADLLDPEVMNGLKRNNIYKVVLDMEHFLLHEEDDKKFDFTEYLAHPERYRSRFTDYLPSITVLVNGIYWEERFPRLVTKQDVKQLFKDAPTPRLTVIGDVTCDPEGSIECTLTPTLPDKPVFVYRPETEDMVYGFEGDGLLMMTVDILPTEIPITSSEEFGAMLKPFLPALAFADYSTSFDELELPPEFKRAVIAHKGELTPDYRYLQEFLG
ncbi:hypothetical protein KQI63_02735 [bacterium]|nr:hypothetical protein [bacterium]